jgi:hypothetical protein
MTFKIFWSLVEDSAVVLILGMTLVLVGLLLLREYAKIFRHDPQSTMSTEILFALITQTGAPGYLAAFLFAAAILCVVSALMMAGLNIAAYLGAGP